MPIDDIVSEGYSNLEAAPEAAKPSVDTKETKEEISVPAQDASKTTKESEALENDSDINDDDSSDDSTDEESIDNQSGKSKKSRGIEKRIKKLTKAQAELRAENQYLKEQAMRFQQMQSQPAQVSSETQKTQANYGNDGKPNPDDFETNADYVDALTEWRFEQADKARAAKAQAEASNNAFNARLQKHEGRVSELKAQVQDYDLVYNEFISEHPNVKVSQAVADMVLESDISAHISYELFKNPDLLINLSKMNETQAAREIGKIESRLERTIEERKKQTKTINKSNAPAPLGIINSSNAGAAIQKSLNEMTADEYIAYRAEQRKR